jgi:DNA excision repair protein ERCC-4
MIPHRVIADEREKASGIPQELSKLNVRVYYSQLPVADYVVSPEVAVERKSLSDFVSSVYDGRIFAQAAAISNAFSKPYLLVEGDLKEIEILTRNISSYYGAIANVTLAYSLRILHTANRRETALAIAELVKNSRVKPLPVGLSGTAPKSKNPSQQQVYFLSSLPGVGVKLAKRLLSRYGTPRRVMNLTKSEFALTPGVGWKKAEKIQFVLDRKFGEWKQQGVQTRLSEDDA